MNFFTNRVRLRRTLNSLSGLRRSGLAAALSLALAACATVVPHPEERDVPRARQIDPSADLARLRAGRELFVRRCSGCHSLPEPSSLRPDEWPGQVADMAVKAKLKGNEQADIALYLQTIDVPR